MKLTTSVIALSALILFLVACKKEKIEDIQQTSTPKSYASFLPMTVGNYWIYQRFNMDGSGNENQTTFYDSIYIEKDTLINGKTYFKQVTTNPSYLTIATYLRDSIHYIVNNKGEIMFSSEDFTNTFNESYELGLTGVDTLYFMHSKMTDKDQSITTPSGTYTTSNFQITYSFPPSTSIFQETRYANKRYAKNVGVVIETFNLSQSNSSYQERRLVRYHLE